jgi:hypothetical protein
MAIKMNKVKIEEAISVLCPHAVTKVVPCSFKGPTFGLRCCNGMSING